MLKFKFSNGWFMMHIRDKWGGIYDGPVTPKGIRGYLRCRKLMKLLAKTVSPKSQN
jgi:hypothetical protein